MTLQIGNGITTGPDGNVWYTGYTGNSIARVTPTGVLTVFPVPTSGSLPYEITTGPDGNLWFTEYTGNKIVKATVPIRHRRANSRFFQPPVGTPAVTVQIFGGGFQSSATVKLTGVGPEDHSARKRPLPIISDHDDIDLTGKRRASVRLSLRILMAHLRH